MRKPKFGTITTKTDDGEQSTIVREGYFGDRPKSKTVWFQESTNIDNGREQLLTEVLAQLDLFLNNETDELDLELRRNSYGQMRLTKRYIVK